MCFDNEKDPFHGDFSLLSQEMEFVHTHNISISDVIDPYFAQFLHALVWEEAQAGHKQPDPREAPRPEDREKGLND